MSLHIHSPCWSAGQLCSSALFNEDTELTFIITSGLYNVEPFMCSWKSWFLPLLSDRLKALHDPGCVNEHMHFFDFCIHPVQAVFCICVYGKCPNEK